MFFRVVGAHARLIGFEELGQTDQFTTSALEFRLKQTGKWLSVAPARPTVFLATCRAAQSLKGSRLT